MTIKASVLTVSLSFTNGKLDTALSRRIVGGKIEMPAEIRKAALAKIEEVLEKVGSGCEGVKITWYVPKVEIV